eukprot:17284-Heterococcus_DN1.PRE.1
MECLHTQYMSGTVLRNGVSLTCCTAFFFTALRTAAMSLSRATKQNCCNAIIAPKTTATTTATVVGAVVVCASVYEVTCAKVQRVKHFAAHRFTTTSHYEAQIASCSGEVNNYSCAHQVETASSNAVALH